MGQKVNPNGFRVGVIRDWNTHWFAAKKDFADCLVEDRKIRDFVKKKYYQASISRIVVDRATGKISVGIYTAHFRISLLVSIQRNVKTHRLILPHGIYHFGNCDSVAQEGIVRMIVPQPFHYFPVLGMEHELAPFQPYYRPARYASAPHYGFDLLKA